MLALDKQLACLKTIWGGQKGYVFLPWYAEGTFHNGPAYMWPADQNKVKNVLANHNEHDLYFTPGVFAQPARKTKYILPELALWADLDYARAQDSPVPPSIAWESSPGRQQAVWILSEPLPGASLEGGLNQALSASLGADPSGWDSTQLLRVPGRPNHKTNPAKPGKLLWARSVSYARDDWPELRHRPVSKEVECQKESELELKPWNETYIAHRAHLSTQTRQILRSLVPGPDRSAWAWTVLTDMAEHDLSETDALSLVIPTQLGTRYTESQWRAQWAKAAAQCAKPQADSVKPKPKLWGLDWLNQPRARPQWLARDLWHHGAVGFIAGVPKSYKSWFALDFALSVSTGRPVLGQFPVRPGPVLYVQAEDPESMVAARAMAVAHGKGLYPEGRLTGTADQLVWAPPEQDPRIHWLVQTGLTLSNSEHLEKLDTLCKKHRYRLIVIDTLGMTLGAVDINDSSQLMSRVLRPLRRLAHKYAVAIVIVHHNRKATQDMQAAVAGQRMLGSVALHAWTESAWYIQRLEDGRVQLQVESKHTEGQTYMLRIPHMVLDDDTQGWRPELLADEDGQPPTTTPPNRIVTVLRSAGSTGLTEADLWAVLGGRQVRMLERAMAAGQVEKQNNRYVVSEK